MKSGESGGRLTFENPFSWWPVQKSNYSQGWGGGSERHRDVVMH